MIQHIHYSDTEFSKMKIEKLIKNSNPTILPSDSTSVTVN